MLNGYEPQGLWLWGNMPAQQVMGPTSVHGTLSSPLSAMMSSAVYTARSSLSSATMTTNKGYTRTLLAKGVRSLLCCVGLVCGTS